MEDKSGEPQALFNYCQAIGLTSDYCIFQDFQDAALDIFKAGGYKTMKIGAELTETQITDYDYFCCSDENLSTFQAYSGINNFIYYTNFDPVDHQDKLNAYNKLSGCFSDIPVAAYYPETLTDISLLNPYNGFISSFYNNLNASKYTRYYQDNNGDFNLIFHPKKGLITGSNKVIINCFNYSIEQGLTNEHIFYIDKISSDATHWAAIAFKLKNNNTEYDTSETRKNTINVLFNGNSLLRIYSLINATVTEETTQSYSSFNYKYFKITFEPDGLNFNFAVSGALSLSTSYTLIKSFSFVYSDFNFNSTDKIYLAFMGRDTWVGKIKYLI
jgi:hypothetical protein